MSEKPTNRNRSMATLYWFVLGAAFVVVLLWNAAQIGDRKSEEPGNRWRQLTESFRSESEQLASKRQLFVEKLETRKAEIEYQSQNRKLDLDTGLLAQQQKAEDLRRTDQLITAMMGYVPELQKGQQELDVVFMSETGNAIARNDDLVKLFVRFYNRPRLSADELVFRIREAQALRDEIAKEDAAVRGATRTEELSRIEEWESDARSSKMFYVQAQMQVQALVEEAQKFPESSGPKITLIKAIERQQRRTTHDQLFPPKDLPLVYPAIRTQ